MPKFSEEEIKALTEIFKNDGAEFIEKPDAKALNTSNQEYSVKKKNTYRGRLWKCQDGGRFWKLKSSISTLYAVQLEAMSQYGGYSIEAVPKGASYWSDQNFDTFKTTLKQNIAKFKTITEFKKRPSRVRQQHLVDFIECPPSIKDGAFDQNNIIVFAKITAVTVNENGRIDSDPASLSKPDAEVWILVDAQCKVKDYGTWHSIRHASFVYNREQYCPVKGGGKSCYMSDSFNSPYVSVGMLTTKDRDNLELLIEGNA